jgi:exonuclease VII large subunit
MENLKQYLPENTTREIEAKEEEVRKSNEELEVLESRIKVENKMSTMKDIPEEIAEDVKYSAEALESMLIMEKDRNAELEKELKVLNYRKQVINKFEDGEL